MILALTIIFVLLGSAALWWLSGFDARVTGENRQRDWLRRATRCLVTLVLLGPFFGINAVGAGYAFIPLIIIIPASVGLIWSGCLAELLSRTWRQLVDPDDQREIDPHAEARNLDRVASLLKSGQHEEAVQLCAALRESGGASGQVLDTMLARAGIAVESPRLSKPLNDAHRARMAGNFAEAEGILNSLLAENPSDVEAAMMLMRLYAQDLRRIDKAREVLRALHLQPHVSSAHIEYAERSLNDWSQPPKPEPAPQLLPESVDALLAGGFLGSAIETLERTTAEQPDDFDSWLKLAEAYAVYSANVPRAEKIIRQIEGNRAFSAEQIQAAKAKLAEWREARSRGTATLPPHGSVRPPGLT